MGHLYLPSFEEKKFVKIGPLNQTEADAYCRFFVEKIKETKKVVDHGSTDSDMIYFGNFNEVQNLIDIVEMGDDNGNDVEFSIVTLLGTSKTKNVRGIRPVYIDIYENLIGIGSTVIYNKNWATIGFDDSENILKELSIMDKLG